MNIIFHHPLPLNDKATSASGIRPLRMLAAFKALGHEVDLVTGYSAERKRGIEQVKKNIQQGKKYDFVYAESSTMPTILTDPHHLPLHPLMDWFFFRFCNKKKIPVGLFYRDIYWLFDGYGNGLNPIKTAVAKAAYWFDLWVYQQTLSKLYLPSEEMGRYVPVVNSTIFASLAPGHTSPILSSEKSGDISGQPLKLFYVGGMSSHYQLHKLFAVVSKEPRVELTICTREAEWSAVQHEYPSLTENIKIVHLSGAEMEAELRSCDIAVLFVKPQEYWEFASPVKLYEYLGYQKPILASEGTLAGRFVNEQGVGWTLPYKETALSDFFDNILSNPSIIENASQSLMHVAPQHSWQARAQQVIKDLTQ